MSSRHHNLEPWGRDNMYFIIAISTSENEVENPY